MTKHRRAFLKMAAQGTVASTAGGLVGTARAIKTVSVSGEIKTADGKAAHDVTMVATSGSRPRAVTDNEGRFSMDISENSQFHLGMYEYKRDSSPPKQDGIPFIYNFGEKSVDDRDLDLGTLPFPEAYPVTLRLLNAYGDPAVTADPKLGARRGVHSFGTGPRATTVTENGYVKIDGADHHGVEFAGPVRITADFENTGDRYTEIRNVNEPIDLVAQAGKGFREASSTPTESTSTPTTEEETTTATSTTSRSSTTSTVTVSSTSGPTGQQSENTTNTTESAKRGFFSNNDSTTGDPDFLEDPFFLTVSGFVLSVGGIVHQMVRGD